ncbi:ParA family protein [Salinispora arenicola]|uniref:ParA family protein n=1 Tax=Salinispora arenicola TaxID=168697 RepID=UPI0003A55729|nr:ParA family protein [Salinispora arenicola]
MTAEMTPDRWRELRVYRTSPTPRRLAVVNRKGGSGKTTTAVQLAAALAAWGVRVRITDGDPQLASATYWLTPQRPAGYPTLLDVFSGDCTIREATAPTTVPGVRIVPSLDTLGRVESERPPGSDTLLAAEYDQDADDVDVEIMDAAPSMGLVTVSMLTAATHVAVSMKGSTLDYVGAAELAKPLALIRRRLNPAMTTAAVVMADTDGATVLSRSLDARLTQEYPDAIVHQVPHSVRVGEAPGQHQPLIDYAPTNPVTDSYWRLTAALVPALGLAWKVGPS